MALLGGQYRRFALKVVVFLILKAQLSEESSSWYALNEDSIHEHDVQLLSSYRVRRDTVSVAQNASITKNNTSPSVTYSSKVVVEPAKSSVKPAVSVPLNIVPATPSTTESPAVTQRIPNVGVNGSGIHRDNIPKVGQPDDVRNLTNPKTPVELPEVVKPETDLNNLTKVDHEYYHSTFIGEPSFFNEHWANISKMHFDIHPTLSDSHRRATMVTLKFEFPFYGQELKNVTVATGGFIYTGEHVHNWLAATQYIAPLMANFDTTVTKDSIVKIADDGYNFTVVWENVTLQNYENESFTFAVTLRKDGDIIFTYKNIPMPIQNIEDTEHPVKIGISDAYLNERVVFFKRRKIIYEYHRVNLLDHNITSGTILRLHANPTCLLFNTCTSCMTHNTTFNCTWCPTTERCSNGFDKRKKDFHLKDCGKGLISQLHECLSPTALNETHIETGDSPTFKKQNSSHDIIFKHDYVTPINATSNITSKDALLASSVRPHSSVGGLVVLLIAIGLLAFGSGWAFYAYKNPHTRSGQLLIKYRPSTWNWKRGEARYTAATIHM